MKKRNAETQRTQSSAKEKRIPLSAFLCVLCVSAFIGAPVFMGVARTTTSPGKPMAKPVAASLSSTAVLPVPTTVAVFVRTRLIGLFLVSRTLTRCGHNGALMSTNGLIIAVPQY
jgi:hypothetical protein